MKIILAFLIGCFSTAALAQVAETFTLQPVSTIPEAVACAKAGGRGAQLYTLKEDGYQEAYDGAFCVTAIKS